MDLYVLGAGGLGRGIVESIQNDFKYNRLNFQYDNIYFIDDNLQGETINGVFVAYTLDNFIAKVNEPVLVINAIGSPKIRYQLQKRINDLNMHIFPNYIEGDVVVPNSLKLGIGNIISRGVVLSANVSIGDFNLIHFNSSVGHDVNIGDYNCIYPICSISGYSIIGNNNMFGTMSIMLPNTRIDSNNVVGANSLINKNFNSYNTLVGTPARIIKRED